MIRLRPINERTIPLRTAVLAATIFALTLCGVTAVQGRAQAHKTLHWEVKSVETETSRWDGIHHERDFLIKSMEEADVSKLTRYHDTILSLEYDGYEPFAAGNTTIWHDEDGFIHVRSEVWLRKQL